MPFLKIRFRRFQRFKRRNFETSETLKLFALLRESPHFGLLRGVRVFVTLVNFQLAEHLRAELRLRQHTLYRVFDNPLRLARKTLLEFFRAQTAGVSRVAVIDLLL